MTEKKLPVALQPEKVAISLVKFEAQAAELAAKFNWDDEKLDAMLVHVDEQEVVKGAKKTCTQLRTAIAAEHKELKAPYLAVGKALDGAKKKATEAIQAIEAPLDAAVARRKKADEDAAKAAQAAKDKEKDDEIARLKAQLEAAGLGDRADKKFEDKTLVLTVETATQVKHLKALVGAKQFKELQFDEQGQPYVLKVTVTRDSYDEDC